MVAVFGARLGDLGLGFRVQGFRVQGSGFRVQGLGFRGGFRFRVWDCNHIFVLSLLPLSTWLIGF